MKIFFRTSPVGILFLSIIVIIHSCKKDDNNLIIDSDGNIYTSITIGTQVWMVENLKTTKYNDGTNIPLANDNSVWSNLNTAGYCWYNNDAATYNNTYGVLYNWYAINTGNLCPYGWHVPTDGEWTILTTFWGGSTVSGGKLKEQGTIHWQSPNTEATNESGFTGLPGGNRYDNGTFGSIGTYGGWWSSTEISTSVAWSLVMGYNSGGVNRGNYNKPMGFSVRCIKD